MSWRDSAEVGRGSEQFPAGAKFDVELIGPRSSVSMRWPDGCDGGGFGGSGRW